MIDAHFHIWQLARGDYGWLTPAQGAIFRDVTLDDWRNVSRPCGITGGILVQAAPTAAETTFLLQQARGAADVLGVVGWVDMLAPDVVAQIKALAAETKLKGLRPMLQDIADPDWILQDVLHAAFIATLKAGLTFDALVKPVHLPRILKLAQRYPALRIVIDHGGKPDIGGGQWSDWARDMQQLAQQPQVFCKLSGLWTEAAPGAATIVLDPYVRHILSCFGAAKTVWGSDWPVLERAGGYADWQQSVHEMLAPPDRSAVFDSVARRAYGL